MSNLSREIISRTTMAVLGLALLYGSLVCFRTSMEWRREWREMHPQQTRSRQRDMSGANYPFIAGIALLPLGAFLVVAAVVSSERLLHIFGVGNTTLHERPNVNDLHGPWR